MLEELVLLSSHVKPFQNQALVEAVCVVDFPHSCCATNAYIVSHHFLPVARCGTVKSRLKWRKSTASLSTRHRIQSGSPLPFHRSSAGGVDSPA